MTLTKTRSNPPIFSTIVCTFARCIWRENRREYPLTIPAGGDSGLTIATAFSKVEAVPLSLTLNFNLSQSIDAVGTEGGARRYLLKPVIRLSDDSKTGAMSGQGPDGALVCAYKEGNYQPGDDDDDDVTFPERVTRWRSLQGEMRGS
jgi:hypothetical protein